LRTIYHCHWSQYQTPYIKPPYVNELNVQIMELLLHIKNWMCSHFFL
jgi:hypothetical protein